MRYLTNDLDERGIPTFVDSDEPLTFYNPVTGRFWEHADDPDHPYGAEMAVRVVTTPHGIFRACVRDDPYADAPDHEAGCPVFRVESHPHYIGAGIASKPEVGEDSWRHDGLTNELHTAVDKFARDFGRDNLEVTDRWLRIFHGGSLKVLTSSTYQGGDDYITYDTRAMRAHWGQTGDLLGTSDPDNEEWRAYLDGEVYSVAVERQVLGDPDDEPTWEDIDGPIHGYYGQRWALEAAEDELVGVIEHRADQMLPLGGAL